MVGKRKMKENNNTPTDAKLPKKCVRKASKKMEESAGDMDELDEEKASSSELE